LKSDAERHNCFSRHLPFNNKKTTARGTRASKEGRNNRSERKWRHEKSNRERNRESGKSNEKAGRTMKMYWREIRAEVEVGAAEGGTRGAAAHCREADAPQWSGSGTAAAGSWMATSADTGSAEET
jgi:hypothetical protein